MAASKATNSEVSWIGAGVGSVGGGARDNTVEVKQRAYILEFEFEFEVKPSAKSFKRSSAGCGECSPMEGILETGLDD